MSTRRTAMMARLAWMALVAALLLAAGPARVAAVVVLLLGLGGYLASPLAEFVMAPAVARMRRVCRTRAPDARERCRVR